MQEEYIVFFISFEGIGDSVYQDEASFCRLFLGLLYDSIYYGEVMGIHTIIENECKRISEDKNIVIDLRDISNFITKMCQESLKPVIIIIDEVDQASNQKIFLDFLGMLKHYENDNHYGMNIEKTSEELFAFTSGYPYLVSRLCKIIDERLIQNDKMNAKLAWSREGILDAVKVLTKESSTLFDDIRKKLLDFPELKNVLSEILFKGSQIPYNQYNHVIDIGIMFGFLKEENNVVAIENRIFEIFFYNLFISEQALQSAIYQKGDEEKKQFVKLGKLNMDLVMTKFVDHFTEIYADNDNKFIEENGRRLFLLYLKPIINGTGNYYIEAQTRDRKRTDIIVDYSGERFIIELKIWHGEEYNQRGEKQLLEYLDFYHVKKGYMISFNFNQKKTVGVQEIIMNDKCILEAVV